MNSRFFAMPVANGRFRPFQMKPQPGRVRRKSGPIVSYKALHWGGYLHARAERGRRKAEASGQSPEDMISDLLDKAAGEGRPFASERSLRASVCREWCALRSFVLVEPIPGRAYSW